MCFPIVTVISCVIDFFFDEEKIISDGKCDHEPLKMERGEEVETDDGATETNDGATAVTTDTVEDKEEEETDEEEKEDERVMTISAARKMLAARKKLRELEFQKNKIYRKQLLNNMKLQYCDKIDVFITTKSTRERKRELEQKFGSQQKK